MKRRDAVLTIPAAIAAAVLTPLRRLKANATSAGRRDIVRQAELQRVASLWDQSEALAADIRRRLEAGAEFEHGELGVAIEGDAVTGTVGSDSIAIGGIDIQPVEHHRAAIAEYPEFANETWI